MKNFKFTYRNTIVIFIMTILTFTLSCTFDEEFDPNRPSLEGVLTDASVNQLNNLVVGVESGMRGGVNAMLENVHPGESHAALQDQPFRSQRGTRTA